MIPNLPITPFSKCVRRIHHLPLLATDHRHRCSNFPVEAPLIRHFTESSNRVAGLQATTHFQHEEELEQTDRSYYCYFYSLHLLSLSLAPFPSFQPFFLKLYPHLHLRDSGLDGSDQSPFLLCLLLHYSKCLLAAPLCSYFVSP